MPQDLTAQHIGQFGGAYEPQRRNAFSFEVDVPWSGGKELIRLSLSKAFIPKYESNTFNIPFMNEEVAFAGKPKNVQTGTLEFHDYVDINVRNALLSWYYLVYNPNNGAVGLASQYKRDAYIVMFGPEGSYTRLWKLKGCFPTILDAGALEYASNDQVALTMTVSFDKALPLLGSGAAEPIVGVAIGEGGGVSFNGVSI